MTSSLEIHHNDVGQGDATLFIAGRTDVGRDGKSIARSVLVDGGHADKAEDVHTYITATARLAKLDVIVVTHYDVDR